MQIFTSSYSELVATLPGWVHKVFSAKELQRIGHISIKGKLLQLNECLMVREKDN
jgi:hypothetical protein